MKITILISFFYLFFTWNFAGEDFILQRQGFYQTVHTTAPESELSGPTSGGSGFPGTGKSLAEWYNPRDLIYKVETLYRSASAKSKMKMTIQRKNWSRELVMESFSMGRDKFLTKIVFPKKEEGTSTLKLRDEIWNYFPKVDRIMKIPSAMMGDSWMGSHFTNDDLVKADKVDLLYNFRVLPSEPDEIKIEAIAREDAAVVWGKLIYYVEKKDTLIKKIEYYDEDSVLIRTMNFSEVQEISGRKIPMKMEIIPVENSQESTVVFYENLEFDTKFDEQMFSVRFLKKMGK